MNRRNFLSQSAAVTAGLSLPLPFRVLKHANDAQAAGSAAQSQNDSALLVIFQRGGADGLSTLVPTSKRNYSIYQDARPSLHIPKSELLTLGMDHHFMIHPAMRPLLKLWRAEKLAFLHGAGSPNITRSHFVQQDRIESGCPVSRSVSSTGFLNRTLGVLNDPDNIDRKYISVALQNRIPYSLRGSEPAYSILSIDEMKALRITPSGISPGMTLSERISAMFRGENTNRTESLLRRLGLVAIDGVQRMAQVEEPGRLSDLAEYGGRDGEIGGNLREIAKLLASDQGVKIVATDMEGWDNHLSQGVLNGTFNSNLGKLATALDTFSRDAVALGFWNKLVVVVMTEFGRRLAGNGTDGTDHGRGGVMMVMGGRVNGGQIKVAPVGDAQTFDLADLQEGDIRVKVDYRVVMSEILEKHLGLSTTEIREQVFYDFQLNRAGTCNIYNG